MKYKLDFKKYRKSDVEKYKNISNKTKFGSNASGAIWWPNLQPIQVVPLKSISNYSFFYLLQIGSKFGHQVASLALVPKLATRLSHFHYHIALLVKREMDKKKVQKLARVDLCFSFNKLTR